MNEAALAGTIRDGCHFLHVRVYYEDTDFSGAVYHANYLKFCERGRSDFLRILGIHHGELRQREERFAFVVRRLACEFLAPGGIDDLLTVETIPSAMTGVRLELVQRIRRQSTVLFEAQVLIVIVDAAGRPCRLPEDVRAKLATTLTTAAGQLL